MSFNAAGNSNYASASVAEQTVIQAAVKPTVSFTGAPASAAYQSTFTVSATSNSTSTPPSRRLALARSAARPSP